MFGAKRIVRARFLKNTYLYKIQLEAGGQTEWKDEEEVQREDDSLLYEFWDEREGRDNCLKKSGIRSPKYHVFEILDYDFEKTTYKVQWVGYRPTNTTWEKEEVVHEIAPVLVHGDDIYAWGVGMALSLYLTATDQPFRKGPKPFSCAYVTGKEQEIIWVDGETILRWSKLKRGWHKYSKGSYEFLDDAEFWDLFRKLQKKKRGHNNV
ncbi:uncharacterized protein PG998_002944 [Apiospora kogelbergensis]|uniref:uncharacterized protein n=1 Tax=Apiospora kogelbergensis TaxID=1337665 RepID=UPI00312F2423